jgi:aspartyl-tRNA synthetase
MTEAGHTYRTHTCGELRLAHVGAAVRLAGWIHRVRDHGGVVFIDLRDHYGLTQVVLHPDSPVYQATERWRLESVVSFAGCVVARAAETRNPKIATGEVEVRATAMELLAEAEPVPFPVAGEGDCDEALRLRYRFLDLRRESMHRNQVLRSRVAASVRRRLTEEGFLEHQTPILTCSSPEGARDFLVPSRLHPGSFYALPQAPQIFKQLLMVSGFDRYFQIAPCFRDEDARADRSPGEFYQIDMEMAFVTQEEVFAVVERLMSGLFSEFATQPATPPPFPRLSYREALLRYGTDKPDLRNPLRIHDATDIFRQSAFSAFRQVVDRGGVVRAIPVAGAGEQPRSFFDGLIAFTQDRGGKGLAYITWTANGPRSPIAKFLSAAELEALRELGSLAPGDVIFFVADAAPAATRIAGEVRVRLGDLLRLRESGTFRFCWIVDFPMYEWSEEKGGWDFSHNPFSMPQGGLEALDGRPPNEILAWQYDLVCNGVELSSGAIRNHRPDIMCRAFEIAGYSREEVERRFGGLLNAFRFGAPPHGGIAPGFDRILMLLTGAPNIREVIAFPLNQNGQDLLLGAPAPVSEKALRELRIRPHPPAKPRPPVAAAAAAAAAAAPVGPAAGETGTEGT